MSIPIIQNSAGGMDFDNDPSYVNNGNYLDASNVRSVSKSGRTSGDKEFILGNTYATSIGSVVGQNKQYLISTIDGVSSYKLGFYLSNNYLIGETFVFNTVGQAQTQITALLDPTKYTITYSPTADSLFITISLIKGVDPDVTGWDYVIKSTGITDLTCTVTLEAYSDDQAGENQVIGKYDLLGDEFIFSTPNSKTVADYSAATITGIAAAFNPILTTAAPHGFPISPTITYYANILSVVGQPMVNGVALVLSLSATTLQLMGINTTGFTYTSGGTITRSTVGVGEIGVAQKNEDQETWSYIRLLRSKELGFSIRHRIDCDCEKDSFQASLYYTDAYNIPRFFYYKGAYVSDGAIKYYNAANGYIYGQIGDATKLFAAAFNLKVRFVTQLQAGGTLPAGNYRYSVRLLTANNVGTDWIPLSNEVSVYTVETSFSNYTHILGNIAGTQTPKINVLELSGDNIDIFQYAQFAFVHYNNAGFDGAIFTKVVIPSGATTVLVNHSGNETGQEELDTGTSNTARARYATALNIRIIDNRLVLSNLTTIAALDFTVFTQGIQYSLKKKTLTYEDLYFARPFNVNNYTGYMLNETYRPAMVYELYDGSFTQPFYLGYDITINCDPTSTDGMRLAGLADFDLTSGTTNADVYVPYIEFTYPDITMLVNGVPFNQLVKNILPYRAEVVNKSVIATGFVVPGVSGFVQEVVGDNDGAFSWQLANTGGVVWGEGPLYSGQCFNFFTLSALYPPTGATTAMSTQRRYCAFYSPDLLYTGEGITRQNGDKILNYGQPDSVFTLINNPTYVGVSTIFKYDNYVVNNWATGRNFATPPASIAVTESSYCNTLANTTINGQTWSKIFDFDNINSGGVPNTARIIFGAAPSPVLFLAADLTKQTAFTDSGFYFAQYIRTLVDQYGDFTTTNFVPTGARLNVEGQTTIIGLTVDMFGGDTFTQPVYFKHRAPRFSGDLAFPIPPDDPTTHNETRCGGGGVLYYTQSRVNAQMQYKSLTATSGQEPFPATIPVAPAVEPTEQWLSRAVQETYLYDHSYDIRNEINSYRAFDPLLPRSSDLLTTIAWSDLKPNGSAMDNYRIFPSLNFKTMDLTNGPISHHEILNGELVTVQWRKIARQYFNTNALLTATDGSEVITGSDAVMGRKPLTITTIGSQHKWSMEKGKSQGGDDVFYGIDVDNRIQWRFGRDGLVPISIRAFMDSFFRNNLVWVTGNDWNDGEQGICAVWNQRYQELITTVRAKRIVAAWDASETYDIPEVVAFTPATYSTFNKSGELYQCLEPTLAGESPDTTPDKWLVIPHTNKEYYNEYTIVWAELKNRYECFLTPLPKIYLKWKNTYLTPCPVSPQQNLFEHDRGTYGIWYDRSGQSLMDAASFTAIFNLQPEVAKTAEAMRIASDIVPFHVDITGDTTKSFLDDTDFELNEGIFESAIKNDSTQSGSNSGDTSAIFGRYLSVKVTFAVGVYQRVRNIILKVRGRDRLFNK